MVRLLLIWIWTGILIGSALANSKTISWGDLKDPQRQFHDPYAELTSSQLRDLGIVLQLRMRMKQPGLSQEDRSQLKARLARDEAQLALAGLDVDRLLSQRKAIASRRAKASLAGNPALDGEEITISGYVIPVSSQDGQSLSGYLVPEQGMCSHMPPPEPNQMIRLQLGAWDPEYIYQPAQVTGRLKIEPTKQEITLLDGQVDMIAVFQMKVTDATELDETVPDPKSRSIWGSLGRLFTPKRP
ncbi:DUF3299 domain-containing protein [uncultured Roseibium sp.]|uniref:DUF3299 domain-containing protein n=1 Tax=uncultured Roseibium sp. TaxID=1936171 RepID=UPI0032170494